MSDKWKVCPDCDGDGNDKDSEMEVEMVRRAESGWSW